MHEIELEGAENLKRFSVSGDASSSRAIFSSQRLVSFLHEPLVHFLSPGVCCSSFFNGGEAAPVSLQTTLLSPTDKLSI
jgi:hypothetical protein